MDLDWSRCIICQHNTSEALRCPLQSPGTTFDKTDAYKVFLTNVNQFRELNGLPTNIYFGPDMTAAHFATNRASWHKSCHLKYNKLKLEKVHKRNCSDMEKLERSSSKRKAIDISKFFCVKGELKKVNSIRF